MGFLPQNPDMASAAAAQAALEVFRRAIAAPSSNHSRDLVTAALEAARLAVRAVPIAPTANADPPESTIVVALRRGRGVSLGWVGDSRATSWPPMARGNAPSIIPG